MLNACLEQPPQGKLAGTGRGVYSTPETKPIDHREQRSMWEKEYVS